jgi:hypothetical protein
VRRLPLTGLPERIIDYLAAGIDPYRQVPGSGSAATAPSIPEAFNLLIPPRHRPSRTVVLGSSARRTPVDDLTLAPGAHARFLEVSPWMAQGRVVEGSDGSD